MLWLLLDLLCEALVYCGLGSVEHVYKEMMVKYSVFYKGDGGQVDVLTQSINSFLGKLKSINFG
jgi:hypothetical protein